jgi:hypothetical protein
MGCIMSDIHEIKLNGTSRDIAVWIWKNLVPKSGQADSIQGEILRAIEKLRWEAQENGNINWDEGFLRLIDFLQNTLGKEKNFSRESKKQIASDLHRLKHFIPPNKLKGNPQISKLPYTDDDLYDRLTENLIEFCHQNPQVIKKDYDPKLRR